MHFAVIPWRTNIPQLRYTVEQLPLLVQLYFKYEPTGKIAKNVSSGDEFFENVVMKGHKIFTTSKSKTTFVLTFKEYGVVFYICTRKRIWSIVVSLTWPGFPYMTTLIFRITSNGVQTSRTYSETPSSWRKNWCLVCDDYKQLDLSNIRERTPEGKKSFPHVYWVNSLWRANVLANSYIGELLLGFIKVITTANFILASFINC
jgi:hypothetical protein